MDFINILMLFFGSLIAFYMLSIIGSYIVMLLVASSEEGRQTKLDKKTQDADYINAAYAKPISIIVPAYNEEEGILESVYSLLNIRYPQVEYIIVNDGSTDSTLSKVIKEFEMVPVDRIIRKQLDTKEVKQIYRSLKHPNLVLVDKLNGGKADALNTGINVAKYPYFCSIDGDSILEKNALLRVMKPIINSNEEVIAAGGTIRIVNDLTVESGTIAGKGLAKNPLVIMQTIEYIRAFLIGRIALSKFNLVLIISGAFSVFNRKWVIDAGGYSADIIGEDMELVVKLHKLIKERKSNHKIAYVADPVCYTEAPQKLSILRNQRRRWHQGLLESLTRHKSMSFNPKYKAIGMIAMPYFWLVEALGPIVEMGGYLFVIVSMFLGNIYYTYAIVLFLLFVIYSAVYSVAAILLDAWSTNVYPSFKDIGKIMGCALTEIFWYKPLTLLWRLEGLYRFLRGNKEWGKMERAGFTKEDTLS